MIITIAIQIQSIVLYYLYKTEAISMTNVFVKSNLNLTSYSANYLKDTARTLAMQIFMDKDIQPIMTQTPKYEISQEENYRFMSRLVQYVGIMSYIDSIYVYNGSTNKIYCVNSNGSYISSNISDFYDSDILTFIKNIKTSKYFIPRKKNPPVELNVNSPQYTGVYSYIISNVSIDHTNVENSVVINIKESWLVDLINSMSEDNNASKTIMIDKKGRIIASPDKNEFFKDLSKEKYIKSVLESKNSSGYIVQSINKEDFVVTYVNLNGQEFKLIKLTPYRIVQQNALKIRNLIFLVSVILLILGLGIIVFISFGIYRPFKALFSSNEELASFKRQNLYNIKEKLISRFLISADNNSREYWQEQFAELRINLDLNKEFLVSIIKIDHFAEFNIGKSEKDMELSLFSIANIASEILAVDFKNESVVTGKDHITLLLEVEMENKLSNELLKEAQKIIKEYLSISVSITVSNLIYSLDELNFQFNDTLEMSNNRFIKGHAAIITPDNTSEPPDLYFEYPYAKEQELVNNLMLNKITNAKEIYIEIVESIKNRSYYEIISIFNHQAITIDSTVKRIKSLFNIEFPFSLNKFNNEMGTKETFEEVNGLFLNIFEKLEEEMTVQSQSKSCNKYNKLVEDAKKYIEENFSDINLSMTSIAENFGNSTVYFGRLFKKYGLLSVQDYVNQIRLNEAKKLLEENEIQVGEVYSRVGFVNKTHFYAFFKKNTGITPGEFREQAMKGK